MNDIINKGNKQYAWQDECLRKWFLAGGHGIVSAVTGAGKTRMAVCAAETLATKYADRLFVYVVTPTKALRQQWERVLKRTALSEESYSVFVIHSARYRLARTILEKLREGKDILLVADECHHYASAENQKIFEFVPFVKQLPGHYYSLGLTATLDERGYREVLKSALGKKIFSYDLASARKRGTVAEFVIFQVELSFLNEEQEEYDEITDEMRLTRTKLMQLEPILSHCESSQYFLILKELAGDGRKKSARFAAKYLALSYRRKRLVCMASARLACAERLLEKLDVKDKIMIFGESIEQAERLYARMKGRYGNVLGRYHSKMGALANKNALARFRSGEVRILITCRALDEGIDVPEASVGIVLSGTSVKRQRMQRLGRILRRSGQEKIARLYYLFVGDSSEENVFLPDKGDDFQTEELLFENGELFYPAYEDAAGRLLAQLKNKAVSEKVYEEIMRCLSRGEWRADWLMGERRQRENQENALGVAEKNYWICMRQLAVQRGIKDDL